jgi:1,4-dihydroxy-6-naphthoate synthase
MELQLGFSPCPNDTFIFDALVNKKIDTQGIDFKVELQDVQTLNDWARQGRLDVSKISYGVLPMILNEYLVLNSGGALGMGVGPLLIAKQGAENLIERDFTVAIPGRNTTAHMLFSLAFPNILRKRFLVFNEIEDAVLEGKVDAGVIIHENRFTYMQKGLIKLLDLGNHWEQHTGLAIPLGGIVMRRELGADLINKVDDLIKQSVEYAFANNYERLTPYIKEHAQEMSEDVMKQHINLYVNNYSKDLGIEGKKAVMKLLNIYEQLYPVQARYNEVFA